MNHQKYLSFSRKIEGKIRYFMFTILPFGLYSVPFIFTKSMSSLVKFCRREGIKVCDYMDDGLGVFPSLDLVFEEVEFVRNSLTKCGFITNPKKSIWQPQKELIWLGIKMILIKSRFTIPQNRVLSCIESI